MKNVLKYGVVASIALVIGAGIGSSNSESTSSDVEPSAEPSIVTTTKTVELKVERTPQSCLDALDYADEGFNFSAELMEASSNGFLAIGRGDIDGVLKATERIEQINFEMTGLPELYNEAKAKCRNAQ